MNNKIVASVLSIIAVIVVVYQIFLREDDAPVQKTRPPKFTRKNNTANQNRVQPSRPGSTVNRVASSGIENAGTNEIMIDLYSPQLLERVKPYIDNSTLELEGEIGEGLFGQTKTEMNNTVEAKTKLKIPVLTLNGIIEIIQDKIVVAIINNRLYRKGETVENAVIQKIEKYRVLLSINKEIIILSVNQGAYKGWIKKRIGGSS